MCSGHSVGKKCTDDSTRGRPAGLNVALIFDVDQKIWGAPNISGETFFVDISWWFSRLGFSPVVNSRGRCWLLRSARVAPTRGDQDKHSAIFVAHIFDVAPKILGAPSISGETFFVDISWWFSRLDFSAGENSRGRC